MKINKREGVSFSKALTLQEVKDTVTDIISDNIDKISEGEIVKDFSVSVRNNCEGTTITLKYEEEAYEPTCPYGYDDCVLDPAYLVYTGYKTKEELKGEFLLGCECEDGEYYDDEDK